MRLKHCSSLGRNFKYGFRNRYNPILKEKSRFDSYWYVNVSHHLILECVFALIGLIWRSKPVELSKDLKAWLKSMLLISNLIWIKVRGIIYMRLFGKLFLKFNQSYFLSSIFPYFSPIVFYCFLFTNLISISLCVLYLMVHIYLTTLHVVVTCI